MNTKITAPWEQQPGEPDHAFSLFACYRDLGTSRSIRALAVQREVSHRSVAGFSSTYDWMKRVRAYDKCVLTNRYRKMALEIEKIEDEKLELKVKISQSILRVLSKVDSFYVSFDKYHSSEAINSKIKYLNRLTNLTNKLFKAIEIIPAGKLADESERFESLINENISKENESKEEVTTDPGVENLKNLFSQISQTIMDGFDKGIKTIDADSDSSDMSNSTINLPESQEPVENQQLLLTESEEQRLEREEREYREYLAEVEAEEDKAHERLLAYQGLYELPLSDQFPHHDVYVPDYDEIPEAVRNYEQSPPSECY